MQSNKNKLTRRQKRKANRIAKRETNKQKYIGKNLDFVVMLTYVNLYKAMLDSAKGVKWKASVQKYMLNAFVNLNKAKKDLLSGKDIRKGFIYFDISERGKTRHISSVYFSERVVQKWFCTNILAPVLTHSLIYDNGASQEGKGVHFSVRRIKKHLHQHFNKYGRNGYILLIDFKGYFENINHNKLKEIINNTFTDSRIRNLANDFINAFGAKGLGLGSEASQSFAIAFVNRIDHYIKEVLRIKGYGRYMDDSYLIHHNKEYLQECLEKLRVFYKEFGIILSEKKTYITDLKHGFVYLKTHFKFTENGKLICKPCQEAITRQRRKMKKQAKLLKAGIMTMEQIDTGYQSWLGSIKHKHSYFAQRNMQNLYDKLFVPKYIQDIIDNIKANNI